MNRPLPSRPVLGTAILALLVVGPWRSGGPALVESRAIDYAVSVTPDGESTSPVSPNTNGHVVTFTVRNTGTEADTYEITCGTTTPLTSCSSGGPGGGFLTLSGGQRASIDVTFNVGTGGTSGTVTLYAAGIGYDEGSYVVPVDWSAVAVTPDGGSQSAWYPSTGNVATFTVQNIGGIGTLTYTLSIQGCTT
ncbi:MAG: hypothetical protein HY560_11805, partial [Gemmatimonadetes bacterium]|nr:hypothetical protein [Gemmatimonadota bacterium]